MKQSAVYILASQRHGTLYIRVTSDLVQRVWQHKQGVVEGFTEEYGVHTLVYFELHEDMEHAILREERLKKWNRAWKLRLLKKRTRIGMICTIHSDSRSRGGGNPVLLLRSWFPACAGMTEEGALLDSALRANDGRGRAPGFRPARE